MKDYNKIKKEEFDEILFKTFPKLFKHRNDPKQSLMVFGLEVGSGWHNLIYELTKKVNELRIKYNLKDLEVVQIKEKFGGLRYYINGGNEEVYNLEFEYEDESFKICEKCGKPGKLRTKGWYFTLCSTCNKNRNTQKDWVVYDNI